MSIFSRIQKLKESVADEAPDLRCCTCGTCHETAEGLEECKVQHESLAEETKLRICKGCIHYSYSSEKAYEFDCCTIAFMKVPDNSHYTGPYRTTVSILRPYFEVPRECPYLLEHILNQQCFAVHQRGDER